MAKKKVMSLKNKTYCEILTALLDNELNSGELERATTKSQSVCYRGLRDLENLGYIEKVGKSRYRIINRINLLFEINKLIEEQTKNYMILKNKIENKINLGYKKGYNNKIKNG